MNIKNRSIGDLLNGKKIAGLLVLLLVACFALVPETQAERPGGSGFVYVMTNQPAGNTVIKYARARNGALPRVR